jgi:hypothetical protein
VSAALHHRPELELRCQCRAPRAIRAGVDVDSPRAEITITPLAAAA